MGGGPESRCVGRVYCLGGAVARHHPNFLFRGSQGIRQTKGYAKHTVGTTGLTKPFGLQSLYSLRSLPTGPWPLLKRVLQTV